MNCLAVAADDIYLFMLKWCLASFFTYHRREEWEVVFLDVGCSPATRSLLERIGRCVPYAPHTLPNSRGLIFPAAYARLASLGADVPSEGLYLYLDVDSLFFASLDPWLRRFQQSGLPVALAVEDDPGFWIGAMRNCWIGKIPSEFLRRDHWAEAPILNTGLLLAQGKEVQALATFSERLYDVYAAQLQYAEQTLLASLIYEWELPFLKIPQHVHCFAWERSLGQDGSGTRYVTAAPTYQNRLVTMRHFCAQSKGILDELRPQLDEKYGPLFEQLLEGQLLHKKRLRGKPTQPMSVHFPDEWL